MLHFKNNPTEIAYPKKATRAVMGNKVTVGRNGNLYLSQDLATELGATTYHAAQLHWVADSSLLLIQVVERNGIEKGELIKRKVFAITKQGAQLLIGAERILKERGYTLPAKAEQIDVEVEEAEDDSKPVKVAVVDLKPLLAEKADKSGDEQPSSEDAEPPMDYTQAQQEAAD